LLPCVTLYSKHTPKTEKVKWNFPLDFRVFWCMLDVGTTLYNPVTGA